MADRETKTEAELTALVLQTVRDAGFAWVEAVKLQSDPMRNPNWVLTQIVGKAPTPIHAFWAQHHPTVVRVAGTLSAKAQLAVRSNLWGTNAVFAATTRPRLGGVAGPTLRLAIRAGLSVLACRWNRARGHGL